ncbi:mycofactocin precursor MftA [Streptomyces sp. NPDC057460]|uniref:mycofactocin precursor MftA n=1 Tax=Streptomyces sp. NPDC057460 TaxID=3346141 RepID=UPI0036C24D54
MPILWPRIQQPWILLALREAGEPWGLRGLQESAVPRTVITPEDRSADAALLTVEIEEFVEADDLVEDVSIDGMCGVHRPGGPLMPVSRPEPSAAPGPGLDRGPASDRGLDLDRAWALRPQVPVRPEPHGALLHPFGTRQLAPAPKGVLGDPAGDSAEESRQLLHAKAGTVHHRISAFPADRRCRLLDLTQAVPR